jgi:tetratricopeptide (TPR) repeat protein
VSRRKKHRKAAAAPPVTNGAVLPGDADAALGASRYKAAIEHYKELLKRERRAVWLEGLAAAYAGRAAQLAVKGLVKEALALWRTRAEVCGTPVCEGPYVAWLLQAGEAEQALRLLADAARQPPEVQAQLETGLAGVVLVAPDSALTAMAADSPLLRHRAAAQAALAAYARGDDVAMAEHQQAIPFRSPYRDLRALLKALTLQETDAEQSAVALARVPLNGPFEPLAAALRACNLPGDEWVCALRNLDEEGRALVLDLKGCPEAQRALLLELAKHGDEPAAAGALFDVLACHRRALPEGLAGELCRRLLPHAPERLRAYTASFGSLSAADEERILALAAELKQRMEQAADHWLRLVGRLRPEPAEHRRAAQVLRHLANDLHHCEREGNPCNDVLDWWGQSLELDPDDKPTHVRLIRALRNRSDLKQARARLDAALARFPDDAEVLLEAVETALAGGAFKKVAGLAKRLLELDTINPRVRAVVGQAHLSHARKQIEARNPAGARREIEQAGQWLRAPAEKGLLKLLRGFIEEPGAAGDTLLREGLKELGGTLVGTFHLRLEALRARYDPEVLARRAGVDLTARPPAEEVVALAHALNAARDGDKVLRTALAPLRAALAYAATAQFTEPDQLLVCEALHRRNERELARRYAEAALKRWPGRPVFMYLKAAATYGANPWQMPRREIELLERAHKEAVSRGDQRTALRLGELLSAAVGNIGLSGDDEDDDLGWPADDDLRAMLEMVLAMSGERRFLEIARKQLGKEVFDELQRELGGNKKRFADALMDIIAGVAHAAAPGMPRTTTNPRPVPAARGGGDRKPPPDVQKDLFDD